MRAPFIQQTDGRTVSGDSRRNPANRLAVLASRFLVCFLLLFLTAAPAGAEEFEIEGWRGGPVYLDGDGAFDQCLMYLRYETGMTLVLGISVEGDFLISLSNPLWRLTAEKTFDVGIAVDERHLGAHIGVATDSTTVFILMKYTDDLIQRFHQGKALRILSRKETIGFKLGGVRHALPRLQQCVYEEMLEESNRRRPFAAGKLMRGESSDSPQSANTLNDESAVSDLLYSARLDGFYFLAPDERKNGLFARSLYAWSNGSVIGGLYVLGGQKTGQPVLASLFLSSFDRACKGEFSYAVVPRRLAGGARASRVTGQCSAPESGFTLAISLFPLEENLAIVVHMGLAGADTETARADEAIYGFFTDG